MSYTGIERDCRFALAIGQVAESWALWPAWLYRAIYDYHMYQEIPPGYRVVCGQTMICDYALEETATLVGWASTAGFTVPSEEQGSAGAIMDWVISEWESQQT